MYHEQQVFNVPPEDLSKEVDEHLANEFSPDHVDFDGGSNELLGVPVGTEIPQLLPISSSPGFRS